MNYLLKKYKNYKQYDTRWAKLSYRVLPACVRTNGCGAVALSDIIYGLKSVDPKDIRKWLLEHNYVTANQGTIWDGISACMKAYGFKNVKNHATMPDLFNALAKGNRGGIILFRKGTRGGRTYTASGHFCSIVGYKVKNGKHYLYICDPGPRNNNGWICYESEMYGLVIQVWSGEYPTSKKEEPKKETVKTYKGFDVSYVQNGLNKTDFINAKKAGWQFVIIRLGTLLKGELYTDKEFESKYKNATAAGLDVGVYFYSMAKTVTAARQEAAYVLKQLKDRKLTYPVFIDFEDPSLKNLGKAKSKSICEAFCATIEKEGYDAGVYASYDWLTNKIDTIDKKYYVWLAQYPKATYKGRYEMHQYSSSGKVTGIGKAIDVNVSTIKPAAKPAKKATTETKTNAQKISDTATKLAYKDDCDDAKYPTGKPDPDYKTALDKYFPDRKKWSEGPKAGASCDVFAATVMRASGVDPDFPRALEKQYDYLKNSNKYDEIKNAKVKDLKDGDIIIYKKTKDSGHICFHVGGKIKHASLKKWYGRTTDNAKSVMNKDGKIELHVYRAK